MNLLEDYSTQTKPAGGLSGTAGETTEIAEAKTEPRIISANAVENTRMDAAPQGHAIEAVMRDGGAGGVQKGSQIMTGIPMKSLIEPGLEADLRDAEARNGRQMLHTEAIAAQSREAALSRLLSLLETGATAEYTREHAENALESGVELSQLARLRAAHAAYALATDSKMRRLSEGAWVRERHA